MSNINISKTAAIMLLRTAAELFAAGAGFPLDHSREDEIQNDGLVDEIDRDDSELFYWANELLRFARTVHGIMSNALHDEINTENEI